MKIKFLYTIVIFTVLFVVDKIYFNSEVESIKEDLSIINIAGNQKTACQKIVKQVLYYELKNSLAFSNAVTFESNLNSFKRTHNELINLKAKKYTKNKNLQSLFTELEPHYNNILQSGIALAKNQKSAKENIAFIKTIKVNDYDYSNIMDRIVKEYELIGKSRISKIKSRENIFNTMVILLFINIIGLAGFKHIVKGRNKRAKEKEIEITLKQKKALENLVYN